MPVSLRLAQRPPLAPPTGRSAFTLIELLVVVGLIGLLVGGLSLALGDTGATSLATAQNNLATLVGTARAQAAVHATRARLCVYATRPPTGDGEKFLRLIQVFRNEPADSATWIPVGSPLYLPRGVYLVPNTTTGLLASGVIWPTTPAPVSTLNQQTFALGQPVGMPFNNATVWWIGYTADGALEFPGPVPPATKLVVATATTTNSLPSFNNAGAVRGLLLRHSGAITRVNEAGGF